MSPASQGNLEVERYIGSCLISARSNNNNNNSSKSSPAQGNSNGNHLHQHHHANYMSKKVDGNGNGNGLRGPSGRLQSRALLGCPHHGYAPPGSLVQPMCDCAARYGSPGHSPPGGGWTGVPLISMATNGRRNRKPTPGATNAHRNQSRASPASPCAPADGDPNMRSPLSRLAIHTQGAPLILSGHYNGRKNNNNNNNVVQRGPGRQFKGELPGRRCVEVPREIRGGGGGGGGGGGSNNTPNSDCLSVASDESSGHSENSLPRIIKPRKRRKKDRKPAGGAASDGNNAVETDAGGGELTGIVTLKPYVPLCHELYEVHRGGGRRREDDTADRRVAEHRIQRSEANPKSQHRPVEDTRDVKKVQTNHVEHVDAESAGQNTLFPFPCQPSTCQCRYCDPAGLIWDVDQHCYSPFLTPSSIDLSYPLFLTPPLEAKSFDFFNKDFKDSSSNVADSETKELVRRSWSEPSASTSASCSDNEETRRALNDFGVIGGGRTCDISARGRKDSPRHTSTSSESSTHSTLSQNLEVSTEIVTSSLNGHRDLEIKFFSSTPPNVLVDVVGENSGCENVDWGSSDKGQQELWIGSHQVSSVFSEEPGHRGSLGSSVWGNPVVGDGEGAEDRGYGDQLWPETWQDVVGSTLDSNSKILSEEVNQLCLQNAEE